MDNCTNCADYTKLTEEEYCAYKNFYEPWIIKLINTARANGTGAVTESFFGDITEWKLEDEDGLITYKCDQIVVHDGDFYQATMTSSGRHPHDCDKWRKLGNLSDIFTMLFDPKSGYKFTIPYWEACQAEGCFRKFDSGVTVAEKRPVLDENGEPVIDNCGNPVLETRLFTSLKNNNLDRPSEGALKDPKSWDGGIDGQGYKPEEFLNRPVGHTLSGEMIKPGSNICLIDCNSIGKGLVLADVLDDEGNPAMHPETGLPIKKLEVDIDSIFSQIPSC